VAKFSDIVDQARVLLESRGRLSYRALKREFDLDDETLEDLKAELIDILELAVDKDGKMLVWTGWAGTSVETPAATASVSSGPQSLETSAQPTRASSNQAAPEGEHLQGERRQLTVMFCDLVGSTALSEQLDPEDLHALVRAYQDACRQVVERYDGHIAQYLGDGILVYFGYPAAHEEDAVRGVRAGLEIISALQRLSSPFQSPDSPHPRPLLGRRPLPKGAREVKARIGVHTGPVVIGAVGGAEHTEQLALGETPNIAARVQGKAGPNTVVISTETYHLVQGFFVCEDLGPQELKGLSSPLALYQVMGEGEAQISLMYRSSRALRLWLVERKKLSCSCAAGTGQGGAGPSGLAERGSWYWQVTPGAGITRSQSQRAAPEYPVSLLALLSEQRPLPDHRPDPASIGIREGRYGRDQAHQAHAVVRTRGHA
jgi:class 3 adenylate cyclase